MFLTEVLIKKNNIQNKLKKLEDYMLYLASNSNNKDSSKIDETLSRLYKLLGEYQNCMFVIDDAYHSIEITIGNSRATISEAVKLRKTIKEKIRLMDGLIHACEFNENSLFDIFELIENRDKLMDEYNMLNNIIKSNDWKVDLGN